MTTSRLSLKATLCMFVALLTAALWTQPASAYTWARRVTVYNAYGLCVQGNAGIDHKKPGVLSGNLAYSETFALKQGCGTGLNEPDGWAATRAVVFKWNGSGWDVCRSSAWKYGATGVNRWGPWGPEQVFDWGGWASCGAGFYGTQAAAFVWDGSAWRGGGVWSGFEQATPAGVARMRQPATGSAPAPHVRPPAVRPAAHTR
ncbi:hypothetical protein ACFWPQ_07650 [Streptomyces sp. NPDC058464]|uniref:hypothetical protein n=1 Tax=Streptomyces sp. NPDC058464 TaxID=3346511 RepID=UPI00364BDC07